jgi:hypothetical protein
MSNNSLIDLTADMVHQIWMGWAKAILDTEQVSQERVDRWAKCMVSYDELQEEEKQKDIEIAEKILS